MNYKPDESTLMAYLYGELEGQEKDRLEQYLLQNPEARIEIEKLNGLRKMMGTIADKEVIAPSILMGESKPFFPWDSPYIKTIISIAASFLLIILVGKFTDVRINYASGELKIGFGEVKGIKPEEVTSATITADEVQQMIKSSLLQNNSAMQTSFEESQKELDASIQKSLTLNSSKINQLVKGASNASQEQVQQYVAGLQNENTKLVKEYFQLTSTDQKKYIEDMLVDFAKYMHQQRSNDLQAVQTRLNSLEENTDIFKQETEQILSSIITNAGSTNPKGINN